jgi:uncharacterized protein involved in outer membrane biogenesis
MKLVKRIFLVVGGIVVLLIAAAIILPVVFKDEIKAAIDREIAKSVNADVLFDVSRFNLTLFRNFPNMTIEIGELGVFNRAPFEGVPLFVMQRLEIELNLKQLLIDKQLRIKGIRLIEPQITINVLKDGRANYDITYPSAGPDTAAAAGPAQFQFAIDHWAIVDGDVVYDDQTLPYFLKLKGLSHQGRGDFSQALFDLRTRTTIDTVTTRFAGMELLANKRVAMDAVIEISEGFSRYTFKENEIAVNDFKLAFDGWFKMNENHFDMDIRYASPETSFKSLLSLVPGMYTQNFGAIKTAGTLAFSGFAKGIYAGNQLPAFQLALQVNDAMFQYPGLPQAVRNIQMDLLVDNPAGIVEQTIIHLKNMHLDFGSNPVDARLRIDNLKDYRMDAGLQARLNLGELTSLLPLEGMELKGLFAVNATARGVYDSVTQTIPAMDVAVQLTDGFAKTKDFPLPLEQVAMQATVKNTSGKIAETVVEVKDFGMVLDGEPFSAAVVLQNLADYTWDVRAKGGIDLGKMTKIFPLENMTLTGHVQADLQTKGRMSDVTAARYDRLPTRGTASVSDFAFAMKDLPYGITVSQARAAFDPAKIELQTAAGTIGKSDFAVSGSVRNYIGYIFGANEVISGNLDYRANLLDLNEFMTSGEEPATDADTASLSVIPIPRNVDFTLRAAVKTTRMMDYTISDAAGNIILRDGVANLSGLRFNLLGGTFLVNGSYSANDIQKPRYDFDLKIDALSIQQAASSFSVVKTYAPIAGLVNGNFGTDFKISGLLQQNMMPDLATVSGAGLIKIAQAALTQSKIISGVTALTKLSDSDQVTLRDVVMSAAIENGKFSVKPFDVRLGNYTTTVSGSTALNGTIDYVLRMNVPAGALGALGAQYQGLLAGLTGHSNSNQMIPVSIGIGGTYANPQTRLLMTEQRQQVQQAKEAVKEEVKQTVTQAVEEKKEQAVRDLMEGQRPKEVLNNLLRPDSARRDSAAQRPAPVQQLQNKLNNLLRKRNN